MKTRYFKPECMLNFYFEMKASVPSLATRDHLTCRRRGASWQLSVAVLSMSAWHGLFHLAPNCLNLHRQVRHANLNQDVDFRAFRQYTAVSMCATPPRQNSDQAGQHSPARSRLRNTMRASNLRFQRHRATVRRPVVYMRVSGRDEHHLH
jgi:hypothetical protein